MPEDFLDVNEAPPIDPMEAGTPVEGMDNITGDGLASVMPNPLEEPDEQASPEEQAEYREAFKRVMGMVHDTSENDGKESIADGVIKTLSNTDIPAHKVIGKTGGNLMRLFHELGKRNKKEWSGDVLREVGMDLVTELIDIARVTGAQKEIPEDDTPEGEAFYQQAVLEAAKEFGNYMLNTGQADVEGTQEGYKEQMRREASSGALDDWNMQEMNPEQMEAGIAEMRGFA
jgi:hypothetical protein